MLDPASPVIQQQNPCQDEVRGAPQHFHPVPPFFHTAGRVWEGPFPALRTGSARKSSGNGTFLMPSDVSRHLPGAGGVLFLLSPPPSPEGAKDRVRKCPWSRNWDQGTQREPFAAVSQPAPKENPFPHSAGPSLSPMAASAPLGAPQPHHNYPGAWHRQEGVKPRARLGVCPSLSSQQLLPSLNNLQHQNSRLEPRRQGLPSQILEDPQSHLPTAAGKPGGANSCPVLPGPA